ncbi:glycogen debranching protein GlgX [Actinotalea fermentans]|uniref:Glycogen operon protein GlgX homolog n=1 Tax=Actinotalea fermentans TaxID=43671 RepID=A0A511YT76_9CELL|nr:glycogen debranching protein GlgX [Actinotalea fermentans]GEN78397.1 glycogen operon protein GlgX homolog [Actinotalea fermentans]
MTPGRPVPPLGVRLAGDGIDVAVLASHADAVELCLLDPDATADDGWRERRIPLAGPVHGVWHAHVPGVVAGQHYGLRAHGRWDPDAGLRYNPAKLLLDPYARGIVGEVRLGQEVHGQRLDESGRTPDGTPQPDPSDSRAHVPHAVVVDEAFGGDPVPRPHVPWPDTVIYEAHVRGLTQRLPGVPEDLRGTYAGLAHPATIEHLQSLGVTTLELLPIQAIASEPHLVARGLTNYWGYNTLGFFAPHPDYATRQARAAGPGAVLAEVKGMVRLLHAAGIEVVLDVVYNHTCEGGTDGPQLSWRGLDPTVYYLHHGATPARFADLTGCGNTLDFRRPRVVQLALDSLRYWAGEVGIDGFRFDLAVTLGRDGAGFTPQHPFLVALQTDPVLSDRKLIAEPWDLGPGGWRTGAFPEPMAEWNDRFRDGVRTFWLSDPAHRSHGRPGHGVRELATRLSGSADLFGHGDPPASRGVVASVNFVTAHDGFTLADLVTYDHKRNEANGEGNRDGSDNNLSWSHGIDGPVRDPAIGVEILPLRRRSQRNLIGMLAFSAGTPMITAGDELGRTQGGNNNAYCQDNTISWLDWELDEHREDLLATARHLFRLRRELPALRSWGFYTGRPVPARVARGDDRPDLEWRRADGGVFDHGAWHDPGVRSLQMVRVAADGSAVLLIANGSLDPVEFTVAAGLRPGAAAWTLAWDSAAEHPGLVGAAAETELSPGTTLVVEPLSLRLYTS